MRRLLCVLLAIVAVAHARAQPPGQRFVSISFHDIVDDPADLTRDRMTPRTFVLFLDWLTGTGWEAVSLDELSAAARGLRKLPDKAILLTFDDGFRSLYTRVFPLLKAYHYPAVAALVGSWMKDTGDGTVLYGDKRVPRTTFISWAEAREMEASGLVEFASHSYDLHRGIQANPQGNRVSGVLTWRYDPRTGTYEDDVAYMARLRADLAKSRALMETNLGHPPRAIVWPYGRYTGPALDVVKELGFGFALTLNPEPAYTSNLYEIPRYFPSQNPSLADIVRNLRFEPDRTPNQRIACLTLDALAAVGGGGQQDEALGRIIEDLRTLGPTMVVIDAHAALPSPGAPLGDVYFPSRLRHMRRDLLSRATWQIRTRAGADVYLHLPLAAAAAAVGDANVPRLFAEMVRHARADGIVIDMPLPTVNETIVAYRPEIIRARRAALDPNRLNGAARLGLLTYRAAARIVPRLSLMLAMRQPSGPPDWADLGLLPPSKDVDEITALAIRLRAARVGCGPMSPSALRCRCRPSRSTAIAAMRHHSVGRCGLCVVPERARVAGSSGAVGRLFIRALSISALRPRRWPPQRQTG